MGQPGYGLLAASGAFRALGDHISDWTKARILRERADEDEAYRRDVLGLNQQRQALQDALAQGADRRAEEQLGLQREAAQQAAQTHRFQLEDILTRRAQEQPGAVVPESFRQEADKLGIGDQFYDYTQGGPNDAGEVAPGQTLFKDLRTPQQRFTQSLQERNFAADEAYRKGMLDLERQRLGIAQQETARKASIPPNIAETSDVLQRELVAAQQNLNTAASQARVEVAASLGKSMDALVGDPEFQARVEATLRQHPRVVEAMSRVDAVQKQLALLEAMLMAPDAERPGLQTQFYQGLRGRAGLK